MPVALVMYLCIRSAHGPPATIEATRVIQLQSEAPTRETGRYDWGPSVMLDDDGLYKMWWVRLGGSGQALRFPYEARLSGARLFTFTYPDWGDRIYYAESRDGLTWHLDGPEYRDPLDLFGPEAAGPMMVLGPAESLAERNHVGTPSVIKAAGIYYMYYESPADYHVDVDDSGQVTGLGEYHNQVFVATSSDGKHWRKRPTDSNPRPIVAAPRSNLELGRQRYGLGQPSVFYEGGRFVLHYVDSCTGPGDFVVRLEAADPYFHTGHPFATRLQPSDGADKVPAGAVARFAQVDVKPLNGAYYLLRPAYGTGCIGLLASRDGVFRPDTEARTPTEVFPQIRVRDPRGEDWLEVLYPRFLTDPHGKVLVRDGMVAIYYSSGRGWKDDAHTWDIFRCEVPVSVLRVALAGARDPR